MPNKVPENSELNANAATGLIQATVECGFTLKRVRDMTRTYS